MGKNVDDAKDLMTELGFTYDALTDSFDMGATTIADMRAKIDELFNNDKIDADGKRRLEAAVNDLEYEYKKGRKESAFTTAI
mgnify:CR=1 FL=1